MVKNPLIEAVGNARANVRKAFLYCAAFALVAMAGLSPIGAHAQTTTVTYGLGQDGAPAAADYAAAAAGFSSSIGPILQATLPLLLLMLAIWQGPRLVKSLVMRFSR